MNAKHLWFYDRRVICDTAPARDKQINDSDVLMCRQVLIRHLLLSCIEGTTTVKTAYTAYTAIHTAIQPEQRSS